MFVPALVGPSGDKLMEFKYSCFISYRDYRNETNSQLIRDLHEALSDEMQFHLEAPVFLDEERLGPGYSYNEVLATALCESLCMILVYTPRYFDANGTYCAREYRAMVELEKERLSSLPDADLKRQGLIIPIVIRGEDDLPAEIKSTRTYWNFGAMTLAQPVKRHPEYAGQIKELAAHIGKLYKSYKSLSEIHRKCDKYRLPLENDDGFKEWLSKVTAPPAKFPMR